MKVHGNKKKYPLMFQKDPTGWNTDPFFFNVNNLILSYV